jgi:low temperature requirement protein LtrA
MNIILSGLGFMAAIWWLYFEHSDKYATVRPKNLFLFLHAHGFLYISIILLSVGYKLAIEGQYVAEAINYLLLGGFGVAAMILLIRSTLHGIHARSVRLVLLVVGLGAGGLLWGATHDNVFITTLVLTVFFMIVAALDYFGLFDNAEKLFASKQKTSM